MPKDVGNGSSEYFMRYTRGLLEGMIDESGNRSEGSGENVD